MLEERVFDLNKAIHHSKGGIAQIWEYSASLTQMIIRIKWDNSHENLHLTCNGCIRFEAITAWGGVNLEWEQADSGLITLLDREANFLLICHQIRVSRNVDPLY